MRIKPIGPIRTQLSPGIRFPKAPTLGGIDTGTRAIVQGSRVQRALRFEDVAPGEQEPYIPSSDLGNGRK